MRRFELPIIRSVERPGAGVRGPLRELLGSWMKPPLDKIEPSESPAFALEAMVRCNCSGVVFQVSNEYRLLHFLCVRQAWEKNRRLRQIGNYTVAGVFQSTSPEFSLAMPDYLISGNDEGPDVGLMKIMKFGDENLIALVSVWSRHERFADVYMASSPGYVCTGPQQHAYPPLKPRSDGKCAARPCPGRAP